MGATDYVVFLLFVILVFLRTATVLLMVALANFVGLAGGLILGLTTFSRLVDLFIVPSTN